MLNIRCDGSLEEVLRREHPRDRGQHNSVSTKHISHGLWPTAGTEDVASAAPLCSGI